MFEAAELGRTISKEDYKERVPQLRIELLEMQRQLTAGALPGHRRVRRRGRRGQRRDRQPAERVDGSALDRDARLRCSRRTRRRERPEYWRYWRDLPPNGRIGLFLSSWYSPPVLDRVYRRSSTAGFRRAARSHRGVRADAHRRRRVDPEVLDAPREGGAEEAAAEAREGSAHAMARHEAPVEALAHVRQVRHGRRARPAAHEHGRRALDDRRGRATKPIAASRSRRSIRDAIRQGARGGRGERPALEGRRVEQRVASQELRDPAPRAARGSRRPGAPASRSTILSSLDMSQHGTEEGLRDGAREASGPAESACSAERRRRASRRSWCSKGGTRRARAARSGASPARSTRGRTRSSRSPRRPTRSARTTISGASGVTCRAPAGSPSSIAAGTAACSSSASRASRREQEWKRAYSEINEFEEQLVDARHRAREVLAAHHAGRAAPPLQGARDSPRTSSGSSPTKTGATGRSGATTSTPSTTWSSAPARASRRGRSSRATTSTSRA